MKRILAVALSAVLLVGSLCACTTGSDPLPSRTGFALDTVVTITIYESGKADAQQALDKVFAEIDRLESLLSVTNEHSDVSRINAAAGRPVTVATETAEVLMLALQYAELSDGALDITIRPASALWDFNAQTPVLPDTQALQQAVNTIDYRQLTVEGNTVTLTGGAIDLGGIAKGYIADRVAQVLQAAGVTAALIDLGGNIVALGSKSGDEFRIGIKDPAATDTLAAIISGTDISAVTSGIYERGFTWEGVRYHHLLDPKTGMPVQNTLASVTVVCERSADADALSTACFVLGEERATALIESLEGVEALFIRRDGTIFATDGLLYAVP